MSKKITFDQLLAKREQREADKLRVGMLKIPGTEEGLEARMPSKAAILEIYGEGSAAVGPEAMLRCGNHALYACCPQLQDRELQRALGVDEDPMGIIDALFSLPEQDLLGGQALRFLGLLAEEAGDGRTPETAEDTAKN